VPDPGGVGARLYRSGDIGRRLAGDVEYLRRNDDQVKVRGYRIELGEIEAELRALPALRDAAVLARSTPSGDPRLVAYVVAEPEHRVEAEALRRALAERLPSHSVPSAFVFLEALPLTEHGKLARGALPEPPEDTSAHVPPRTASEALVCRVYAEVLEVSQVGAESDFFALGGHSLAAVRVVNRLAEALGRDVPLRDVFECPVVTDLAARLERATGGEAVADDGAERLMQEWLDELA
jgi:acyl carrier protein